MLIPMKTIWIVAVIAVVVSMLWFLFGSTTFFNRTPLESGPVTMLVYLFVWTPALAFVVVSIRLLKKDSIPSEISLQIIFSTLIVIVAVFFVIFFLRITPTDGWLTEKVEKNNVLQTTEDDRYEYELAMINPWLRSSSERLYVKDLSTGEEMMISVDIGYRGIPSRPAKGQSKYVSADKILWDAWVTLAPSETSDTIYILTTTERMKVPEIMVFEVNMETRTSKRIE